VTASSPRPAGSDCWCGHPSHDGYCGWRTVRTFGTLTCTCTGSRPAAPDTTGWQSPDCPKRRHVALDCPADNLADHDYRADTLTPDTTGGELREVQRRLADELERHAGNLGARDPSQPGVWFQWCGCGWEGGRYSEDHGHRYRLHVAEALLALPALRDLLAERDKLAAQVKAGLAAAEELTDWVGLGDDASWNEGYLDGMRDAQRALRRALGTPTTGGGQ